MVVALAVFSMLAAAAAPNLEAASRRWRVRLAAGELATVLHHVRATAVRRGVGAGIKFHVAEDGRVSFRVHLDGDGDGVLTSDIEAGVDPPIGAARSLDHFGSSVGFGILTDPPPRDPGDPRRRLDRTWDPVRFNRSNILAFSPLGASTPGSLYVTDRRDFQAAVRVLGRTGRIRILHYHRAADAWARR